MPLRGGFLSGEAGLFEGIERALPARSAQIGIDMALLADGLDKHYARQARAAQAIRKGCRAVGFDLCPESDNIASLSITALIPPEGLDEEAFRNAMLADHGVMIAGGFGELRGKIIRIGHMGPGITDAYVRATLLAVEACVRMQGIR